jgi:hypothetical protein
MNTIDILGYGHQTFIHALEKIPESARETGGVCGVWSTRDILAHLTSYEHLLAEVLSTFLGSEPTPHLDHMGQVGGEAFNDLQVEMRQAMSFDEILADYDQVHARTLSLARQIPAETFRQNGALPWYGDAYDLDDFIVYTNYAHKREHAAEINVFRDHLERK